MEVRAFQTYINKVFFLREFQIMFFRVAVRMARRGANPISVCVSLLLRTNSLSFSNSPAPGWGSRERPRADVPPRPPARLPGVQADVSFTRARPVLHFYPDRTSTVSVLAFHLHKIHGTLWS